MKASYVKLLEANATHSKRRKEIASFIPSDVAAKLNGQQKSQLIDAMIRCQNSKFKIGA